MAQGTVKTYDPATKTGSLLDDAKNEFAFDHDSFRNTGIRMFRLGQRVKWRLEGDGDRARVRDLTLVTF